MAPISNIFIVLYTIYIVGANCNIFSYFTGDSPLKSFVFWPNGTVPFYIVKSHFDKDQIEAILNALHLFTFKTCLKFVPTPDMPGDEHHVMVFHNPTGVKRCTHSTTGHSIEEPHYVTLGYDCLKSPNIDMMIMRALGFPFEHNRASRDLFVTIQQENIESNFMELFSKDQSLPPELRALPYDLDSVMHFDVRDYSKNGHRTIILKDRKLQQNRIGLTDTDLKKIEVVYGSECLNRDRQEKIDLCQFFPGVARRKRQIDNDPSLSLRVNRDITKPPTFTNTIPDKILISLKELNIVDEMQHVVNSIYKVSATALKHARLKYCNKTDDASSQKPKVVRKSGKFEDILGVVELVTKHAQSIVDQALTNLTNFCEKSTSADDYQRSCAYYAGKECKKTFFKFTKFGRVKAYTPNKPYIVASTDQPYTNKVIYRFVNNPEEDEAIPLIENITDVRKRRVDENKANETEPPNITIEIKDDTNSHNKNNSHMKTKVSNQPDHISKNNEPLTQKRRKRETDADKILKEGTIVNLASAVVEKQTDKIPKLVIESISEGSARETIDSNPTENPVVQKASVASFQQKTTFIASENKITDSQPNITITTDVTNLKNRKKRAVEGEFPRTLEANIKLDFAVEVDKNKSASIKQIKTSVTQPISNDIPSERAVLKLEVAKKEELRELVEQEIKDLEKEASSHTHLDVTVSDKKKNEETTHKPSSDKVIQKHKLSLLDQLNARRSEHRLNTDDIYVTTESRPYIPTNVAKNNVKKRSVESVINETATIDTIPIQPFTEKLDDGLATLNVHFESQSLAPESYSSKAVETVVKPDGEEAKSSRKRRDVASKDSIVEGDTFIVENSSNPEMEKLVRDKRDTEDNAWMQHVGQLRHLLNYRRRDHKRKSKKEDGHGKKAQQKFIMKQVNHGDDHKPSGNGPSITPDYRRTAKIERAMEIDMYKDGVLKGDTKRTAKCDDDEEDDDETSDMSARNAEFVNKEKDVVNGGTLGSPIGRDASALENQPISLEISLEIVKPKNKKNKSSSENDDEKRRSSIRKKTKPRERKPVKSAETKEYLEQPEKPDKKKEEDAVEPDIEVFEEDEPIADVKEKSPELTAEEKPKAKPHKSRSKKKKVESEEEKSVEVQIQEDKSKEKEEKSKETEEPSVEAKLEVIDAPEPTEAPKKKKRKHVSVPTTVYLTKKNKEFYNERKWLDGVVPYVITITEGYDIHDLRQRLAEVNKILLKKTCVSIEEITEKEAEESFEDYLVLDTSADYITGRIGGKQTFGSIELFEGGQHRQHTAMMVMAMLGFYFELARHDRDKHVRVHLRHVRPEKLHHFEKMRSDATLPVPYDYESATHPAWQFWRKLGKKGISTVATFKEMDSDGSKMRRLGQHEKLLSDTDLLKINSVYGVQCFKDNRRTMDDVRYVLEIYK